MKRDPKTGAPDFYTFARDYLHTYLPTVARRSPMTIEAYRISLECFLHYLADHQHVERAHVSFDHFDRQHLKGGQLTQLWVVSGGSVGDVTG